MTPTRTAHDVLRTAYAAFNRQDADALLQLMTDDVAWPEGQADGAPHLSGKPAVLAFWSDLWMRVRPRDEVVDLRDLPDGRVTARLAQVIRDVQGEELTHGVFEHTFTFHDGLIARLDIKSINP